MAIFYEIGKEPKEVFPKNKKDFSYEELKSFVNGLVEIVPLPSGKLIIVNGEGKLIGLEKNEKASEEWLKEYPTEDYSINNDGTITGNALIVSEEELGE